MTAAGIPRSLTPCFQAESNIHLTRGGPEMSILQLAAKCTPTEWQTLLDLERLSSGSSDKGLWIDPVTCIKGLCCPIN
jgi:hypothetical protein